MKAKPALSDRLSVLHLYLIPQRALTSWVYWLTRQRRPRFLKNLFIRLFIHTFKVDMYEAVYPKADSYANFNAFFTRPLRPGIRPVVTDEQAVACPVDGTVSQVGSLTGDEILQAKGRGFSLRALLGGEASRAEPFQGGSFATLYLSPRDYHRIHMPYPGRLREMVHVPGRLFSVSPAATRGVPELFARNERIACLFETAFGPMALVMVGAVNVASMETVWEGLITPPLGTRVRSWRYRDEHGIEAISLAKGAEMGRFNMGSTVILIAPPSSLRWASEIQASATVHMGQLLATRIR